MSIVQKQKREVIIQQLINENQGNLQNQMIKQNDVMSISEQKNQQFREQQKVINSFKKLEALILNARKKSRYHMLRSMDPKWIQFLDYCYVGQDVINVQQIKQRRKSLFQIKIKNWGDKIQDFLKKKNFTIPLFDPFNNKKLMWDLILIFALIILLFNYLVQFSFSISAEEILNEKLIQFLQIFIYFDFFVNLNTGIYQNGVINQNRKQVLKAYLKQNFFSDVICNIFILIRQIYFLLVQNDFYNNKTSQSQVVSSFAEPYNFIDLLLFSFIFKIRTLQKLFKKIEERKTMSIQNRNIFQLVKLILTILLISHVFACIWVWVAKIEKYFNPEINSWIDTRDLIYQTWQIQYSQSFYFTMVTMITVGYGDIVPQNIFEIWICILIMIIACMVFAYSMNTIGQIITNFFELETKISDNLYTINSYMKKKKIEMPLQFQVREYLYYYWKHNQQDQQQKAMDLIQNLPDQIQQNLLRQANSIIFKSNEIFEQFSDDFKMKIIPLIQELQCPPGFVFFNQGQLDDGSIYFVQKGKVDLFFDASNQFLELQRHLKVKSALQNDSFGLQQFLTGTQRNLSAKSVEFSNILFIKRSQFIEKLQQFPQDYEKFCHYKDCILNGIELELNIKRCECCNEKTHYIDQCPRLNLKKDFRKISMICNMGQNEKRNGNYKRNLKREKYPTLLKFDEQCEFSREFIEFNQDIVELYQDIIEQEEDFFFYQKQQKMLEFEGRVAQENQLAKNLINNKQELQQLYHQNSSFKNILQSQNTYPTYLQNNVVKKKSQDQLIYTKQDQNFQNKDKISVDKQSPLKKKYEEQKKIENSKKYLDESDQSIISQLILEEPFDQESDQSKKSNNISDYEKSEFNKQDEQNNNSQQLEENASLVQEQNNNQSNVSLQIKNNENQELDNSFDKSSHSLSSEYLEEEKVPQQNIQRKRRETLLSNSNQVQLIEKLREKQSKIMNFLSEKAKSKQGLELIDDKQQQIQKQKLEILQNYQQQTIQNNNQQGINNPQTNELLAIQEMMSQIKQEINQNLNKSSVSKEEINVNLNQDPCFQFEFYFPWHNLNYVLFRRNFKKQIQIKEIRQKSNIQENILKINELQVLHNINQNSNPLIASRKQTYHQNIQQVQLPCQENLKNQDQNSFNFNDLQNKQQNIKQQLESIQEIPQDSLNFQDNSKDQLQTKLDITSQNLIQNKNQNSYNQQNSSRSAISDFGFSSREIEGSRNQINESSIILKKEEYSFNLK